MAVDALNRIEGDPTAVSSKPGDIPERLPRRYYSDPDSGPGLAFYVDATAMAPAFRDQGRRLSTSRNDPNVVRDLVAIAAHRGWGALGVRGQTDFRREVWLVASAAGLEVRGYRPTSRDEQDLARRLERAAREDPRRDHRRQADLAAPGPRERLRVVEAVVRNRIVEPGEQARIIAAARNRLADWLERGAILKTTDKGRRMER